MMKYIVSTALFTMAAAAYAHEPTDTIETQVLNEVVVQADRMYMTNNKVSYTPSKQQRNASANGTMLLQQLAIPQLRSISLPGA